MLKVILGAICGAVLTFVALVFFGGLIHCPAERALIERWRRIHLGMPRSEVERELGTPSYELRAGIDFPEWAEKPVTRDYYLNHGLMVFTIGTFGPQLLFVYIDENERVSYVSSTFT